MKLSKSELKVISELLRLGAADIGEEFVLKNTPKNKKLLIDMCKWDDSETNSGRYIEDIKNNKNEELYASYYLLSMYLADKCK